MIKVPICVITFKISSPDVEVSTTFFDRRLNLRLARLMYLGNRSLEQAWNWVEEGKVAIIWTSNTAIFSSIMSQKLEVMAQ